MKNIFTSSALLLMAALGLASPVSVTDELETVRPRAAGFQNTVYFVNWYGGQATPAATRTLSSPSLS